MELGGRRRWTVRPIDADAVCERCRASGAICTGKDCEIPTMPTLTPPNEWASVEERLPQEKQRVIVRCEHVGTSVGWILWGRWMTDIGPHAGDVTHWMLLPAPPDSRPPEGEA